MVAQTTIYPSDSIIAFCALVTKSFSPFKSNCLHPARLAS